MTWIEGQSEAGLRVPLHRTASMSSMLSAPARHLLVNGKSVDAFPNGVLARRTALATPVVGASADLVVSNDPAWPGSGDTTAAPQVANPLPGAAQRVTTHLQPIDLAVAKPPCVLGRHRHAWRIWADSTPFVESVLTPTAWDHLFAMARLGSVGVALDGSWLICPTAPTDPDAESPLATHLAAIAVEIDSLLLCGRLEPWVTQPAGAVTKKLISGSTWPIQPLAGTATGVLLHSVWPGLSADGLTRVSLDGTDTVIASSDSGETLVMIPSPHPSPNLTTFLATGVRPSLGVETPWQQADDAWRVTDVKQPVGGRLPAPALLEAMSTQQMARLDILGPWMISGASRLTENSVRAAVARLQGVRAAIPRYALLMS